MSELLSMVISSQGGMKCTQYWIAQCIVVNTSVDINNQQSQLMTEVRTEKAHLEQQLNIVRYTACC